MSRLSKIIHVLDDIVHGRATVDAEVSASIEVKPVAQPAPEAPEEYPEFVNPAKLDPIDIGYELDKRAKALVDAHKEPSLDWRQSIVDLLKVLHLDSSIEARRDLATELGYAGNVLDPDDATMNVWLHREVIESVRDHGIQLPGGC